MLIQWQYFILLWMSNNIPLCMEYTDDNHLLMGTWIVSTLAIKYD